MQRVTVWLLVTVVATGTALAQTQGSGASMQSGNPPVQNTAPANNTSQTAPYNNTTPAMTQPNPDGTVTTPVSPTGPTTPIITLGASSSNAVGASSATAGNQAGATNATLQRANSAISSTNQQSPPRDLVVGGGDSAWAISTNTTGVAEAARLARAARAGHKARMFTNADIARLRGDVPVSVVGNTAPTVTNEQTMPASDVQEQQGPTTPAAPQQSVQPPPANLNPMAPKSPFRAKPSPNQPR